jgi:hypothetical protein
MSNISAPSAQSRVRRPRRYLTKRDLQQRYRWKSPLSVDRNWKIYKTIPAPSIYQGRRPLWAEDILDAHDEANRFAEDEA